MRSSLFTTIFLIALSASASALPNSVELWQNQAKYFWSLNFNDEAKFKTELSDYYTRIFNGEHRENMIAWIQEGNLESEYFSSVYSELNDTKFSILKTGPKKFKANTIRNTCYGLDYNPPIMSSIVNDFKGQNCTQEEVDSWLKWVNNVPRAEVCMEVLRAVQLKLDNSELIVSMNWKTIESTLQLKPKALQSDKMDTTRPFCR